MNAAKDWSVFVREFGFMTLACGRPAPSEPEINAYWEKLHDLDLDDVMESMDIIAKTRVANFTAPSVGEIRAAVKAITDRRYDDRSRQLNAVPHADMTPAQWEEVQEMIRSIGRPLP